MSDTMKKLLILFVTIVFLNSCITVVFEPYLGENQKKESSDSHREDTTSNSSKHTNSD